MDFEYTGEVQNPLDPYIPPKDLIEAVNLAILLERPLLLMGEPGCGKTKLAKAVAFELSINHSQGKGPKEPNEQDPSKWPVPLWQWNVKSTSIARDGLYTYDTVGRLRDAQLTAAQHLYGKEAKADRKTTRDAESHTIDEHEKYISYGPLGNAFQSGDRGVVLIDEIDKADIDFPNDLLHELEQSTFTIPEADNRQVKSQDKRRPIIFITSNNEKILPDAFLRRCLFYFIKFPDPEQLKRIVQLHLKQEIVKAPDQELDKSDTEFIAKIVERFCNLREKMEPQKQSFGKKISTSELLDWAKAIVRKIAH